MGDDLPPKWTSVEHLVAARGLVSPALLDEISARQLIYGGDFAFCLLELAPDRETALTQLYAEFLGLRPAAGGPQPIIVGLSQSLAAAGINAFASISEQGELRIAASSALSEEVLSGLGLRRDTDVCACLPIRVVEARAFLGIHPPPSSRDVELLTKLGRRVYRTVEVPSRAPPLPEPVAPLRMELDDPAEIEHGTTAPPPVDYEDIAASAAVDVGPPTSGRTGLPLLTASDLEPLAQARSRDAIVDAALAALARVFRFTACFAVQKGEARGLRKREAGDGSVSLESVGVPLDLPGIFQKALANRDAEIVRPKASGLDGGVLTDLGRPAGTEVLLVPVLLRKRPVLLLWLDNGREGIPSDAKGTAQLLVAELVRSLERLVLEKKGLSRMTSLGPGAGLSGVPSGAPTAPPVPSEASPLQLRTEGPKTARAVPAPPQGQGPELTTAPLASMPAAVAIPLSVRQPEIVEGPHEVAVAPKRSLAQKASKERGEFDFPSEPPGTLKGFPAVTPSIPPADSAPRFSESPRPIAPPSFSPMRPRRVVRVESAPPVTPGPPEVGPVSSPEPVAPPPPLEDARLSAKTMISRSPPAPLSDKDTAETSEPEPSPKPKPRSPLRQSRPPALDIGQLLAELEAGDDSALDRIEDGGESSVAALVAIFPGPVTEPENAQALPSASGPVLRALVHLGRRSVPFLTVRTRDENALIRKWATFVLGEIPSRESAEAIAHRLLDDAPEVRRAALHSARRMSTDSAARRTLRTLIEGVAEDKTLPSTSRLLAIEALADIRESEAIPCFLRLLGEGDQAVSRSVVWALTVLTRQELGSDAGAWQRFWQDHRDEDRVEWLILALDQPSADLRRAAGDELHQMTGENFGFSADLPAPELRNIQARYRQYWNEGGRAQRAKR